MGYNGKKTWAMVIFLAVIFVLTGIIYYHNIPWVTVVLSGLVGVSLSIYTGLIEKWIKGNKKEE